ncbi:MAG: DUF116 domain-containing protein [Methanobacteriaceae archaeon]
MEAITYNLKSKNDDYYEKIVIITNKFLNEPDIYISHIVNEYQIFNRKYYNKEIKKEEAILEALIMGVLWNNYIQRALKLDERPQKVLSEISKFRDKIPELKEDIDNLKGYLATMFLLENTDTLEIEIKFNLENLECLFKYLEATGEYSQELKHLNIWFDFFKSKFFKNKDFSYHIKYIIEFAKWFEEYSNVELGQYTSNISSFINNCATDYINREDIIFCSKNQVEYHLNMVGAEIMNRIYKEEFKERKRKAILVPICISIPKDKKCKAVDERLGLVCVKCNNDCPVAKLTLKYDDLEVYIVSHESTAFSKINNKDRNNLAIVGIACVLNLVSGGWKADSLGIPPQCVILNHVGCNHWCDKAIPTSIRTDILENILFN